MLMMRDDVDDGPRELRLLVAAPKFELAGEKGCPQRQRPQAQSSRDAAIMITGAERAAEDQGQTHQSIESEEEPHEPGMNALL